MKPASTQKRIARLIILQTGACLLILSLLVTLLDILSLRRGIPLEPRDILRISIVTVVLLAIAMLILYLISKRVATKSIEPLKDALAREKAFTSYASHEFRTPLAVLKGKLEVLVRRPRTAEEYQKTIKECINEVDAMNEMLENLLTLTRVEHGKQTLQKEAIIISDIFEDLVGVYSDLLLKRNLKVSIEVESPDFVVNTDRRALKTIVTNLFSNAVKYADEGGSIWLRASQSGKRTVVEVENTGVGIPEADVEHVFEPYFRSIDGKAQSVKGFGIGLTLVSRLSELIDAEVSITSSEQGPTCVTLKL